VSQQDLKKIFDPFYTNKVMGRSGTGLGMAVVWGTVNTLNNAKTWKKSIWLYAPNWNEKSACRPRRGAYKHGAEPIKRSICTLFNFVLSRL
jgi:hypothetical protein